MRARLRRALAGRQDITGFEAILEALARVNTPPFRGNNSFSKALKKR